MEHILYSDGNLKKISWVIQTNESIVSQTRVQTENYKDKITYIKNDVKYVLNLYLWKHLILKTNLLKIKLDKKIMYQQLKTKTRIKMNL